MRKFRNSDTRPRHQAILRRGLSVKYIRVGLRSFEDAVAPAGLRISDDVVGVREQLRIELIRMLL